MKLVSTLNCVTVVLAVALSSAASSSSRADECDDIITALKEHGDRVPLKEAKTPPEFCAAVGRLHGIMVSIREIAKQCFDEGEKRTATMKDMDEGINGMQGLLDTRCK
jgi:hypothetical protein